MSDLIYCYPESNVLKNKLNIRDVERLRKAERILVSLRLNDLLEEPILGRFDLMHLQQIHHYLFQDIYTWAGEIRTVDIAKSNLFCKVQFIIPQAEKLFAELRSDAYLTNLTRDEFVKKCAYYFSEINALHPFREGNGRTQREFIRQLALSNGYILRFLEVTPEEMLQASIDSFACDYRKMEQVFDKALK